MDFHLKNKKSYFTFMQLKTNILSQVRWYIAVIPGLQKLRQENGELWPARVTW